MVKARGWLAIRILHKIRAVRIRSLTLPAPFQYHLQSMNIQTPGVGTRANTCLLRNPGYVPSKLRALTLSGFRLSIFIRMKTSPDLHIA